MKLPDRIRSFLLSLKIDLIRIEGNCKANGEKVSIVCAVGTKTAYYLAEFLFEPGCQITPIGPSWLWSAARKAKRSVPDSLALFIEMGGKKLSFFESRYIKAPIWVQGEIPIPVPEDLKRKETYKADYRKFRKAQFHYEVTRDPKEVDDFFQHMYQPYIARSHGDSAIIKSKELLFAKYGTPELLLIRQGRKSVAGMLISKQDEVPKVFALGIRDGSIELQRNGALFACYYCCMEYLEQQGYSKVNFGGSRGFIKDGVLTYKRKFGNRITGTQDLYLLLKIYKNSETALRFFSEMPLIIDQHGSLYSLVFADQARLPSLHKSEKERRKHFLLGTSALLACNLEAQADLSSLQFVTLEENR